MKHMLKYVSNKFLYMVKHANNILTTINYENIFIFFLGENLKGEKKGL